MFSAFTASAARITAADAECAARSFASEGRHLGVRLGLSPSSVRGSFAADGSGFYAVRMAGGGTVFLSGDDELEPVIAYTSADVDWDSLDPASPLRVLLERDVRVRRGTSAAKAKWRRLFSNGDAPYPSLLSLAAPSAASFVEPGDVRVPALVETRWNQTTDRSGSGCFNLYTPEHSFCGCVATAMAQIMRRHRWPDATHAVATKGFQCYYNDSGKVLYTQGGTYDWDRMPTDADGDRIGTDEQRRAIGRLASDAGISVRMYYTTAASSTFAILAANAFMDTWNFGQANYLNDGDGYLNGASSAANRRSVLTKALFANFDVGCPVMLGIGGVQNGVEIGHSVVADGYGYDGDVDYVHLNLGWSGSGDLWYNLPEFRAVGCDFNDVDDFVYNIFPTNGTDTAAFSGRVVDQDGKAVAGASVKVCVHGSTTPAATLTSSDTGVYGAILACGSYGKCYDVTAVSPDLSATGSVLNVKLVAPKTSGVNYSVRFTTASAASLVKCSRNVYSWGEIGNSWGNDIVLRFNERHSPTNFYVSASSGVDAPDRGTSAAPYATIQYAVTNGQLLVAGDVINVLPGVYYGCVETPETPVSIVSTDGPEVTLIDGEGRDCCYFGAANPANLLAGFTLTNGAYYGGLFVGTATNCVIVGCKCSASNAGYGGGAYAATLYGCVLHNNEAYYGGGAAQSTLVNCTVYDNWAYYAGGGIDCNCVATNSIVWRNWATDDDVIENWELYKERTRVGYVMHCPSFVYSCTTPDGFADHGGNITNDPLCVSFDVDDWRLRIGSPCAGTALDGLNMGAWQGEPIVGYVISTSVDGRGDVSPRSQFVLEGGDAVFAAEGDHPFLGFATNGVFASSDRTFVWPDVRADGTLAASFGVTNYCLDAVSGDDANDGLTWAAPLRTIFAMTQKAGRGDTARMKPGVYDGCDWCVYGVEVESTDGASATVIDGGGTNRCVYADDMTYRGVTFRNGNARTDYGGGALYGTFVDCVFSNCTAAFGGAAAGSTFTNCLVTGNSAVRYLSGPRYQGGYGGGVYECDLVNSTVVGNTASSYGGGAYLHSLGEARNSIVCGNVCSSGADYGNDVYGNRYWTMSNTIVDVDARFRDAANGDYRILPTSPAFDAGSADFVAVDHDLAGTGRVWGASVDCGCYEYHLPPGVADSDELGIAAALAQTGYRGEFAAGVPVPREYAYLVEWTLGNGLAASDLNASPTGMLSPALGADGLLALAPTDLVIRCFAPVADDWRAPDSAVSPSGCVWKVSVSLPGYDPERIREPLLKAAVGVVGSEEVDGGYSADELGQTVVPTATNVEILATTPSSATNFFIKAFVR